MVREVAFFLYVINRCRRILWEILLAWGSLLRTAELQIPLRLTVSAGKEGWGSKAHQATWEFSCLRKH